MGTYESDLAQAYSDAVARAERAEAERFEAEVNAWRAWADGALADARARAERAEADLRAAESWNRQREAALVDAEARIAAALELCQRWESIPVAMLTRALTGGDDA